ncbi:MAG: AAA family ATPase [Bacteroidaceae bacterium]|nr:AAA family ATPase [Bacteroidaceae bacterium]
MITYIKIDGFKSFHDFEMAFTPLTVIAGSNAAGKSNLFDAFRLLASLADADKIQKAFREQRGDLLELFTQYEDHTIADRMSFVVEMLVNPSVDDTWGGKEYLKYTRLRYELRLRRVENSIGLQDIEVEYEKLDTIKHDNDRWIKILPSVTADIWRPKVKTGKRQTPYMYTEEYNGIMTVIVPQDGSQGKKRYYPLRNATKTVLSSFDSVDFKHILAAKEEMKSWRFLQLNPDDLRMPTSKTTGEDVVSATGQNLAAALYRIKQKDNYSLKIISRKLQSFIPNFVSVDVIDDVENKQYIIVLKDRNGKEYTSRVLSEGTMRVLTLCILLQDEKHNGLLCFEEPENGIHPFRIKAMTELLKDLSTDFMDTDMPLRQVIINTHSTIFVKEMNKWLENPCLTIAFAQMVNSALTVGGEKKRLLSSKIIPVPKNHTWQTSIPFSEQEKKMTTQMIMEYLREGDNERTLDSNN